MEKEFEEYLLKDQIIYESDKENVISNLKKWGRRLPPILAGTIATAITSNSTYLGIGSILLILEEIGFNLKDLINLYKTKTGYKLDPDNRKESRVIQFNILKSAKRTISLEEAIKNFHYDFDITCTIYEIEQIIEDEELDIILGEIDKYIVEKGYEHERNNIFKEYYKSTISKVINDDSGAIDYYDFMNNLCFFQEIGLCDKKEILELAKKIVKALNEAFPPEELKKI
jgi:hypothetical protein